MCRRETYFSTVAGAGRPFRTRSALNCLRVVLVHHDILETTLSDPLEDFLTSARTAFKVLKLGVVESGPRRAQGEGHSKFP